MRDSIKMKVFGGEEGRFGGGKGDPSTEGSPFPPPIIPLILHKISGIPEKLLGIGNGETLPLGGALGVIPRHGAGFHDHNVRAPLKRLLAGGMNTDVRYVLYNKKRKQCTT